MGRPVNIREQFRNEWDRNTQNVPRERFALTRVVIAALLVGAFIFLVLRVMVWGLF